MPAPSRDYAHTGHANRNRARKVEVLAAAARQLGLMPFELQTLHGTAEHAQARDRVRRQAGLDRTPSVETWNATITRLEALAFEVPGVTFCARCDFPVLWVTTDGGKRIDLDPFPHPLGSVYPHQTSQGPRARVFTGGDADRPDDAPLYRQHARSCPETPAARQSRVPRCTVCGHPLYKPLADIDPAYTTHPGCDPRGGTP